MAPLPSVDPGTSPTGAAPTPFNGTMWQRLNDFPFAGAFQVTSVAVTPAGYAAVGFAAMAGEDYFGLRQGIVWTSSDGRNWEAVADPAFEFTTPEKIVALDDALYVFGTIETCGIEAQDECPDDPEVGYAVWRSISGGAWERLPQDSEIQTGGIDGVAVAYGNLVAFGWAGDEAVPTIWVSPDGIDWGATTSVAGMEFITALSEAPGGVAAFGTRYSEELDDVEVISAFSPDGVTFGSVPAPEASGAAVNSLEPGVAGLVGVGQATDEDLNFTGFALHSADGQSWTEASAADGSFDGAELAAAHSVPGGYLALGIVPESDNLDVSSGYSWISNDGLAWSGLAPFGESFTQISASAAGPSGVLAFTFTSEGFEGDSGSSVPSAWLLAP